MFDTLKRETAQLLDNTIELSWYMRGGVPYEQMLLRTPIERDRIQAFISRKLNEESKKPFPVY